MTSLTLLLLCPITAVRFRFLCIGDFGEYDEQPHDVAQLAAAMNKYAEINPIGNIFEHDTVLIFFKKIQVLY